MRSVDLARPSLRGAGFRAMLAVAVVALGRRYSAALPPSSCNVRMRPSARSRLVRHQGWPCWREGRHGAPQASSGNVPRPGAEITAGCVHEGSRYRKPTSCNPWLWGVNVCATPVDIRDSEDQLTALRSRRVAARPAPRTASAPRPDVSLEQQFHQRLGGLLGPHAAALGPGQRYTALRPKSALPRRRRAPVTALQDGRAFSQACRRPSLTLGGRNRSCPCRSQARPRAAGVRRPAAPPAPAAGRRLNSTGP